MIKNITRLMFVAVFMTFATVKSNAQQVLIHYWDFNSFAPGLTGGVDPSTLIPIKATYSVLDTNKATIAFSTVPGTSAAYMTYWDNYIPGDTINLQMSDTAGSCLRIWNPTDSMQLLFNIPTTGYKNINLTYETQKSSLAQAQLYQAFDYSTDSGATWKTAGLSIPGDSAIYHVWAAVTVHFNDTTVNNNGKLIFRIKFLGQNSGTSGNNRFDNVTVEGDSLNSTTGVSEIASNQICSLYPSPANNVVFISSNSNNAKTIIIHDINGKIVYRKNTNAEKCPVNITAFTDGVYFVTVMEEKSGYISHLKFIKN